VNIKQQNTKQTINRLRYLTLTKGISFTKRANNETKASIRFSYTRSFRLWCCSSRSSILF